MLFVSSAMFAQVIYSEDFESYTSGDFIAASDTVNWTTWSNAPGTAEDGTITTIQAGSGTNSLMVSGVNDLVLLLGDVTTGKYEFSFELFVPLDTGSYFNLLQEFAGGSSAWSNEVYLLKDSTVHLFVEGNDTAQVVANAGEWHTMLYIIDLDNDYCIYQIDGTTLFEWPWSLTGGMTQLGGANFYAADIYSDGAEKKYIDDIKLEKLNNVSIKEISEVTLQIYPNPTTSSVHLESTNEMNTVKVLDITGSVVLSENVNTEIYNLNLSSLANGIYYVQINYGDKIVVRKVVKK